MHKPPLVSASWTATQRTNAAVVTVAMFVMTVIMWTRAGIASDAQRWPSAPGIVVSAAVAGGGKGGYRPQIVYQYEVAGVTYASDRYTLGTMSHGGRDGSEATVAAHAPGTPVRVYYDPADPSQATLQRDGAATANLIMAALACAVGVAVGYFRFVRREPAPSGTGRRARLNARTSAGTRR
jgi:hypothetical protein